jgi:hypothetical protein
MIIPVPDPRRDFDHPLLGHPNGQEPLRATFDPAEEALPTAPVPLSSGSAEPIPFMSSGFEMTEG